MPIPVETCVVCASQSQRVDQKASYELNLIEPFQIVQCTNCGLRWLNPAPTDQEYEMIYTASYWDKAEHAPDVPEWIRQFPAWTGEIPDRNPGYSERLQRLKSMAPAAKSVIDIGTGFGSFLAVARDLGWDIEGIELSEFGCQTAMKKYGIAVKRSSLDDYDAKGRTFDVVHLSHVFEHFTHPDRALDKLITLMHPGSLLVIEVPNQFREWVHLMVKWIKRVPRAERSLFSIHHPFYYQPGHIVRLCVQRGLTIRRVSTHFPERWNENFQRKVLGKLDQIADSLGRHGTNIEVVAELSQP